MDTRAFRVAQQFIRAQLRRAAFPPDFVQWVGGRRFPNPNPRGRLDTIKFNSLPPEEQQRIYEQWRGSKDSPEIPSSQVEVPSTGLVTEQSKEDRALDIARKGRVRSRQLLHSGGVGAGPVNASYIVELELDGETRNFIQKPAEGESPHLRIGIPAGQYHAREAASYSIDRLIGGRGVVPVTHTRGSEDGSYQLWAEGSKQLKGTDMNELVFWVPLEELSRTPDFERLNVLDLITGNEDRHRGNLLYTYEGDERPENLRFIAIDNGLSLAAPSTQASHRLYVSPFTAWYNEPRNTPFAKKQELKRQAEIRGNEEVARTLAHVSPELHERLKKVDLSEMAKSMSDAGIDDEGAVRAALLRMAALQEDPGIFAKFLDKFKGDLGRAWQEFQHMSGQGDKLLDQAGASGRAEDIRRALESAKPQGGWGKSFDFDEGNKGMQDALQDADNWGQTPQDPSAWLAKIENPDHRKVLAKIWERGEIGEEELIELLGNAHKMRQFSNDFDQYRENAPFEMTLEQTSKGKVYKRTDAKPDQPTRKEKKVDKIEFDEHGFAIVGNVRDRWLSAKVTGRPRGRKLTVSVLDLQTRKAEPLGEFELNSDNKVEAKYFDFRFRNEVQRGIPLMGLRVKPEDGPRFMYALEKVYGARTTYEVRRS